MNTDTFYLKLRANIALDGDVLLAEREAKAFFGEVEQVFHPSQVMKSISISEKETRNNIRTKLPFGFICRKPKSSNLYQLAIYLSFIQEVWLEDNNRLSNLENFEWAFIVTRDNKTIICMIPLMCAGEILSASKNNLSDLNTLNFYVDFLSGSEKLSNKFSIPSLNGGTSTPHVHNLHKYKAKFFPRLIRSLIVSNLETLPKTAEGKVRLLDPFVGSGTAMVEASMLGIDANGIDIDKLSCAISTAKVAAMICDPTEMSLAFDDLFLPLFSQSMNGGKRNDYKFPSIISKKFERTGTLEDQKIYEEEISSWRSKISSLSNEKLKRLLEICLSDALTRKFNIRMMGTGVGRFALEIGRANIDKLMESNIKGLIHSNSVCSTVISAYKLSLGKVNVCCGTALDLPFRDSSFSIILTSPPYLPASSGRENYLIGKAISNTALELMTEAEISKAETESVGSMSVNGYGSQDSLPHEVFELYNWLQKDPLREIKAKPTLNYYMGLKNALKENFRVLLPNGLAIYVIGKESVFYTFKTREVLYRVECDSIFKQIAESCGFIVEDKIDVELDKRNKNARPRSLDSYYETVFLLRKPN